MSTTSSFRSQRFATAVATLSAGPCRDCNGARVGLFPRPIRHRSRRPAAGFRGLAVRARTLAVHGPAWTTQNSATATRRFRFPSSTGSEGERAIDISRLRKETGLITLDPGLRQHGLLPESASHSSTARRASCAIAGTPSRSWPQRSSFLEVARLLIRGELPDRGGARRVAQRGPAVTRCCTSPSGASSTRCPPTRTRCP